MKTVIRYRVTADWRRRREKEGEMGEDRGNTGGEERGKRGGEREREETLKESGRGKERERRN